MQANYSNEHSKARVTPSAIAAGAYEVSHVFTDITARKQGYATQLMQTICLDADDRKTVLTLTAKDTQLKAFYERFGFMQIQTKPLIMARMPQIFKVHMNPIAYAAQAATNG